MEKNFDFEIFVLKYVLKHSESIPILHLCIETLFIAFLVRAPDSINGDGSAAAAAAAAASGAEILISDNFEMTHCINLCYSLKFRK